MKKRKVADFFARYIAKPILSIWTGKVSGLENLPKEESFILAPNHCSYIEHFLLGAIIVPYLDKKMYIIAKKEHYEDAKQKTWHKFWMRYVPQIPIDRSKGEEALKSAVNCLKGKNILVIYPEGTRSLTGKIQKGKTGVARLALWARVPVVPVGIKGTFEILPKGKKMPRLKKASFNFGMPVYFSKYYKKPMTKRLLRKITDEIMEEIARLSGQKYNF